MTVVCEQAHRVSLGSTWASPRAGESGTHVAEGTLAAVSLAELSPDAGDGDGLAAVVVYADMEEVGRDAIVDGRERVGVGELDEGLDVGRGDGRTEGEGGKGEGSCVRGRGRGGGGGGGGGGVSDNGVGERVRGSDVPNRVLKRILAVMLAAKAEQTGWRRASGSSSSSPEAALALSLSNAQLEFQPQLDSVRVPTTAARSPRPATCPPTPSSLSALPPRPTLLAQHPHRRPAPAQALPRQAQPEFRHGPRLVHARRACHSEQAQLGLLSDPGSLALGSCAQLSCYSNARSCHALVLGRAHL